MKQRDVERLIKQEMARWGLENWDWSVEWRSQKDGTPASVDARHEYQKATFHFSPETPAFDESEVRRLVRHEVLHVVLSPLTDSIGALLNRRQRKLLGKLEESLVTRLETTPAVSPPE